jgi:hypothetical protein
MFFLNCRFIHSSIGLKPKRFVFESPEQPGAEAESRELEDVKGSEVKDILEKYAQTRADLLSNLQAFINKNKELEKFHSQDELEQIAINAKDAKARVETETPDPDALGSPENLDPDQVAENLAKVNKILEEFTTTEREKYRVFSPEDPELQALSEVMEDDLVALKQRLADMSPEERPRVLNGKIHEAQHSLTKFKQDFLADMVKKFPLQEDALSAYADQILQENLVALEAYKKHVQASDAPEKISLSEKRGNEMVAFLSTELKLENVSGLQALQVVSALKGISTAQEIDQASRALITALNRLEQNTSACKATLDSYRFVLNEDEEFAGDAELKALLAKRDRELARIEEILKSVQDIRINLAQAIAMAKTANATTDKVEADTKNRTSYWEQRNAALEAAARRASSLLSELGGSTTGSSSANIA